MLRLFPIIYIMAFTTLAGSALVGLMAADIFDGRMMVIATVAAAVVAALVSWVVSRKILANI